jgi:hypothetical protein
VDLELKPPHRSSGSDVAKERDLKMPTAGWDDWRVRVEFQILFGLRAGVFLFILLDANAADAESFVARFEFEGGRTRSCITKTVKANE